MNIRVATSSEASVHSVFIYSDLKELQSLNLSNSELAYVEDSIKDKEFKTCTLNRFPSFIYLVKVSNKNLAKEHFQEKMRLEAVHCARMLAVVKAKSVTVKSVAEGASAVFLAEGLALSAYQFLKYYSDKDERSNGLEEILIAGESEEKVNEVQSVVNGVYTARNLVNEPVSYLTAEKLAEEAQQAGKDKGFKVEVLNKKKIESLKMGGLLAVNRGSIEPPTFSILEYTPENAVNEKPLIFVGKGVVYDTGGLSLKPTAGSMDSMKSDMGGAAAVIGAISAIAEAKLPVKVLGLIPATDNRPGQIAYTPGDVITMYDGSTVEVLNTDAEGRMILADALAYAKKLNPELVIDLATLTGAAAVAIGKFGVVAMGTADEAAMNRLENSGKEVYERIARFPFWDEYNDLLKSSIADVKNIGGREGGAITAGKFLERFTDYPWIHLDIAGPAFLSADDNYRLKGGTGVGVRLLFDFVKSMTV